MENGCGKVKGWMRDAGEIAGGCAFMAFVALLGWLYLIATPDQMSGECDWAAAQMEAAR